jgi:hypothetical protein
VFVLDVDVSGVKMHLTSCITELSDGDKGVVVEVRDNVYVCGSVGETGYVKVAFMG